MDRIAPGDLMPPSIELLVDQRAMLAHFTPGHPQYQVAPRVNGCGPRAAVPDPDGGRVGARPHNEVVLEAPMIAIVPQVHSGIDLRVANAAVGRHVGTPPLRVAADEVVDLALLLFTP